MPVLMVDGKTEIAQSFAINRFLAKRFNLAGKDDLESAYLDSIADLYKDYFNDAKPYILVSEGFREGDKVFLNFD